MCRASLTCVNLDDDSEGNITLGGAKLTISGSNITFTTQQLRQNRRYAIIVTASNIRGKMTAEGHKPISKYSVFQFSAAYHVL